MSAAVPLIHTHLSMDRFATLMGLHPTYFHGAAARSGTVFPLVDNRCNDLFPRYAWQKWDASSWQEINQEISRAEWDMAKMLGYPLAPTYIVEEVQQFPTHHRPDVWRSGGRNTRGARVGIRTNWGRVIQSGRRAIDLVGTARTTDIPPTLTYTDVDLDTFAEQVTITLPTTHVAANDNRLHRVYVAGTGAHPGWEIRPARTVTISSGAVTMTFWTWQFIDPEVFGAFPTVEGFNGIDITNADNLLTSVDVYYVSTSTIPATAEFQWEPTPSGVSSNLIATVSTCETCDYTTQNGCLMVRNPEEGIVVPIPAIYSTTDAQWNGTRYALGRDPDRVKLWYVAGLISGEYLAGYSLDPLDSEWARTVAHLAVTRLRRDFCQCGSVSALQDYLQEDLAASGEISYQLAFTLLENNLGTRRGEVEAWKKTRMASNRGDVRAGGITA